MRRFLALRRARATVSRSSAVLLILVMAASAGLVVPEAAFGQESPADEWFRFLGEINRYRALEPAGSRGSMGIGLAAGAITGRPPTGPASELYRTQLEDASADSYMLPSMWLVKGLPWPVDLGASTGAAMDGSFSQAGGHVQWTVFEELGLPALTLRAGMSRLFGMRATSMTSESAELLGSWGFLRYFTVYAALGATRHAGRLDLDADPEVGALLTSDAQQTAFGRTWVAPERTAGLRVMVWPPFVSATMEAKWQDGEARAYAAKLGVGM